MQLGTNIDRLRVARAVVNSVCDLWRLSDSCCLSNLLLRLAVVQCRLCSPRVLQFNGILLWLHIHELAYA